MLRTLLTRPRWWALTALLVVVVASFARLGLWQLNVAQRDGARAAHEAAASRPEVDLVDIVQPHQSMPDDALGRVVRASGRYDPQGEFVVPGRRLDGADGAWVVTPFVVEETGAVLVAVRGFTTDISAVQPPPRTPVTLRGSLAPGESPAEQAPAPGEAAGPPQRASVDLSALVNEWPDRGIYNAFVFVQGETPAVTARPQGDAPPAGEELRVIPPPVFGETGLDWRNLGYALQWWVFAAFGVYMYWHMLRDDARTSLAPHPTPEPTPQETS